MKTYNIRFYRNDRLDVKVTSFKDNGKGVMCPNAKVCGETSLSVQWMVDFNKQKNNDLLCFQCNTPVASYVEDKSNFVIPKFYDACDEQ
jgi:hypothetical protein